MNQSYAGGFTGWKLRKYLYHCIAKRVSAHLYTIMHKNFCFCQPKFWFISRQLKFYLCETNLVDRTNFCFIQRNTYIYIYLFFFVWNKLWLAQLTLVSHNKICIHLIIFLHFVTWNKFWLTNIFLCKLNIWTNVYFFSLFFA